MVVVLLFEGVSVRHKHMSPIEVVGILENKRRKSYADINVNRWARKKLKFHEITKKVRNFGQLMHENKVAKVSILKHVRSLINSYSHPFQHVELQTWSISVHAKNDINPISTRKLLFYQLNGGYIMIVLNLQNHVVPVRTR